MAETAAQILGPHALFWRGAPAAVDGGRWAFQLLFARRFGIAGGTSETQRNILDERVPGLPSG